MFQSTRHSGASFGGGLGTSERSVLVPPMSNVITFSNPAELADLHPADHAAGRAGVADPRRHLHGQSGQSSRRRPSG